MQEEYKHALKTVFRQKAAVEVPASYPPVVQSKQPKVSLEQIIHRGLLCLDPRSR
jgi:hypothetical protein